MEPLVVRCIIQLLSVPASCPPRKGAAGRVAARGLGVATLNGPNWPLGGHAAILDREGAVYTVLMRRPGTLSVKARLTVKKILSAPLVASALLIPLRSSINRSLSTSRSEVHYGWTIDDATVILPTYPGAGTHTPGSTGEGFAGRPLGVSTWRGVASVRAAPCIIPRCEIASQAGSVRLGRSPRPNALHDCHQQEDNWPIGRPPAPSSGSRATDSSTVRDGTMPFAANAPPPTRQAGWHPGHGVHHHLP